MSDSYESCNASTVYNTNTICPCRSDRVQFTHQTSRGASHWKCWTGSPYLGLLSYCVFLAMSLSPTSSLWCLDIDWGRAVTHPHTPLQLLNAGDSILSKPIFWSERTEIANYSPLLPFQLGSDPTKALQLYSNVVLGHVSGIQIVVEFGCVLGDTKEKYLTDCSWHELWWKRCAGCNIECIVVQEEWRYVCGWRNAKLVSILWVQMFIW